MPIEQELSQLAAELRSEKVAARRAAVRRAAVLLAEPRCQADCRAHIVDWLRDLLAVERYATVRNDAQALLTNLSQGVDPTVRAADRPFMIGVRCAHDHVSYYDRRRVCSGESVLMRVWEREGEREVEMFYVACRTPGCEQRVKLQIDCGEFAQ